MASMVPYRSVFGVRPSASSLFDLFDDMTDLANSSIASKAFPVDVEDKGDGYEVKAYLTGVAKDDIDVELNEGRLSISVNVEESAENEGKNFLQKEFGSYSATQPSQPVRAKRLITTRTNARLVQKITMSSGPCLPLSHSATLRCQSWFAISCLSVEVQQLFFYPKRAAHKGGPSSSPRPAIGDGDIMQVKGQVFPTRGRRP